MAAIAGTLVATAGAIGFVGGRMLNDGRYDGLVRGSTVAIFVGLALFAGFLMFNAGRSRRPFAFWAAACILLAIGLLFVLFSNERIAAIPMAILTVALIAMLWLGWADLCDPGLWTKPAKAERDRSSDLG